MLARLAQVLLVMELVAYAAFGAWIYTPGGWTAGLLVLLAIGSALGARFALVCLTGLLGWLWRSPRAPEERIGLRGVPRYLAGEYRALLADNLLYLPFERWVLRPDPPLSRSPRVPVVLVHGYLSNRGYFRPLVRALEATGDGPVFAPTFPVVLSSIEAFAEELRAAVERIAIGCGHGKVILVCHSMGGLAAREYMRVHGAGRVAKLVTIASPHHGTALASLGLGLNARQMRRDSHFLRRLEQSEAASPPGIDAVSIYSPHDNLVSPQHTSRLPWARTVAVPGVGHVQIIASPRTFSLLRAELRGPGAAAS